MISCTLLLSLIFRDLSSGATPPSRKVTAVATQLKYVPLTSGVRGHMLLVVDRNTVKDFLLLPYKQSTVPT